MYAVWFSYFFRKTKVGQLHMAESIQKNILRLQIPERNIRVCTRK